MSAKPTLFTIGHSTRTLPEFLELLQANKIDAIADVRSSPYSRHMPHFNRESLHETLKKHGIRYVFLGDELGARRNEAECYVNGVAKYELIEKTSAFHQGLQRIRKGATRFSIAMMCAEKDPLTCHRTVLVARALREQYEIRHIVTMNRIITHEQLERNMMSRWKLGQPELFQAEEELLNEAYRKQGDDIAYSVPQSEPLANSNARD